jgi:thiamine biosynthesis protein ThiS
MPRAVRQVRINGEPRVLEDGLTVARLLHDLGLSPQHVAVERNRDIVPKSAYDHTPLCDGDELEIVTFVGGG